MLFQAHVAAQENPIHIQLLDDDQYVNRTGAITTKENNSPKFLRINRYDPDKRVLVLSDLLERDFSIPIGNISKLEFKQHLNSDPPFVQSARRKIIAKKGAVIHTPLPVAQLAVLNNILTLPLKHNYEHSKSTPEVLNIILSEDSCIINWQWVNYEIEYQGGGGSSISEKGIR